MTPEQMQLVRMSLAHATLDSAAVGQEFYRHLFSVAPDLRARFHGDIKMESAKLKAALTLAFGALGNMRFLVHTLEGLARRGVGQQLSERHCRAIAQSVLAAVERRVGEGFTPQTRNAWIALLAVVLAILRGPALAMRTVRAA